MTKLLHELYLLLINTNFFSANEKFKGNTELIFTAQFKVYIYILQSFKITEKNMSWSLLVSKAIKILICKSFN